MANIFISYSSDQKKHAKMLGEELKKHAHNVWLDEWNIGLGDSIVEKINNGLAGANYLLLFWTASCRNSSWVNREWMSCLYRQLSGSKIKIIPIMHDDTDLPAIICDLRGVQLHKDWPKGIMLILNSIGK